MGAPVLHCEPLDALMKHPGVISGRGSRGLALKLHDVAEAILLYHGLVGGVRADHGIHAIGDVVDCYDLNNCFLERVKSRVLRTK